MRREIVIGAKTADFSGLKQMTKHIRNLFVTNKGYYLVSETFDSGFYLDYRSSEAALLEHMLRVGTESTLNHYINQLAIKYIPADEIASMISKSYDKGYVAAQRDIRDALGFI